jgi:hypothetical protein
VENSTIVGVDLAKNVFQLHGAAADGTVLFRKKLTRTQFHRFMADHPACVVAMEACGGAHYWAREMRQLGHDVRLIAPRYVKPFIKRQKNDTADAEAIVEAALRSTMRFVEPKTEEQQARSIAFRTREQLVKQRTDAVNSLRSHLQEFGYLAPKGIGYLRQLEEIVADPNTALPALARQLCRDLLDHIAQLTFRIDALKKTIGEVAAQGDTAHGCRRCPVSDRSPRWRSRPSRRPWSSSGAVVTSPPGSDLSRGRTRLAESRGSGRRRKWVSGTSDGCSSSARWQWCAALFGRAHRKDPGWRGCWLGNRACWSASRWRTGWPAASGPCYRKRRITDPVTAIAA